MTHPVIRCCAVFALTLVGGGCVTYERRSSEALDAFESGRFDRALAEYGSKDEIGGSEFLAGAEAGTVALTAGRWESAVRHFGRAAEATRELDSEALVSPQSAADLVLTWMLNDTFAEYQGEGYERVLLHSGLGLAYLARGPEHLEDVLVEVRLANALLENEEELYESDYGAGGLGHFLSAVAYELIGRADDAYIDYKRMEAKGIAPELAGRALVRLARTLHFDQDVERWEQAYGSSPSPPPDDASVVVIAGVGLGAFKEGTTLSLQTDDGLFQLSVPQFVRRPQAVPGVVLQSDDGGAVRTVVIEDVARVAEANLDDRIAWLAAKSTARGLLKRGLTRNLQDEYGAWGRILGDLFTWMTERADLRAWQTQPDTWQAARLFVRPGIHSFTLRAIGGEEQHLGTLELESGETVFVLARTLEERLYAHTIGGRLARPAAPTLSPPIPETVTLP